MKLRNLMTTVMNRTTRPCQIARLAVLAMIPTTASIAHAGDYDGDGFDDLVGSAYAYSETGGEIRVYKPTLLGSPVDMLDIISQDSPGVAGISESGDQFGATMADGDFDCDGRDDLAVGVPYEDVGDIGGAGMVHVFYGAGDGLETAGSQSFNGGIVGLIEAGDNFGGALAAGDFDGDGCDDLAVGVPGEGIGSRARAGAIAVVYGSATGLDEDGAEGVSQNTSGVAGTSEAGDRFGSALAVGDFDADGRGDLAIGVPGENGDEGIVQVLYGSHAGLTVTGDQLFQQGRDGLAGARESGDEFGAALTTGDFDGDGTSDLAIGVPGENSNAGAVNVIYGAWSLSLFNGADPIGLSTEDDQMWSQSTAGIKDTSEAGDEFGFALAAADFDDDGYDELAIGVPGENDGNGLVNVIFGSADRLSGAGDKALSPPVAGVGIEFGVSLAVGHFTDWRHLSLAVGAPGHDFQSQTNCGAIVTLTGDGDFGSVSVFRGDFMNVGIRSAGFGRTVR